MKVLRLSATLLLSSFILPSSSFGQGSLTPPGPPAPTMKTLDQIEARTIVNDANTPGDAGAQFIIRAPGSYYLTGNINGVSGKDGIVINSGDVNLDLNGFVVRGTGGPGLTTGISVPGAGPNVRVCNGVVKDWGEFGVALEQDSAVDHVMATNNGFAGIFVNNDSRVSDCIASHNPASGIITSLQCSVTRCNAVANGGRGLEINDKTAVSDCVISFNGLDGILSDGSSCSITNCIIEHNATAGGNGITLKTISSVTRCLANNNGAVGHAAAGISAGIRTLVSGCSSNGNVGDGILVAGDSVVRDNRCGNNGGNGIKATGGGSRIEGNQVRDNTGTGILATSADAIIRNSAGGNTTNYNPSSGNNFAPIQTPAAATNPMANINN